MTRVHRRRRVVGWRPFADTGFPSSSAFVDVVPVSVSMPKQMHRQAEAERHDYQNCESVHCPLFSSSVNISPSRTVRDKSSPVVLNSW
jgi:hypothetical protein